MTDQNEFQPRGVAQPATDTLVAAVAASKPKKRIITNVSLHVPGPNHTPFEHSDSGRITSGHYDAMECAPGWPVELDAAEADKILAKHGGEEVGADYEVPATVPHPVRNQRVE